MKSRLLALVSLVLAVSTLPAAEAPVTVTTTKKSAIAIGTGSFALVKGTKLEVLSREGDLLLVKFRSAQGKIPLADTDYNPDTPAPEAAPAPVTAPTVTPPAAPAATPVPAPAAKAVTPPALSVDGKPASTYGKAVQKAKQVEQAHKSSHVDPTKGIMDEEAPKK